MSEFIVANKTNEPDYIKFTNKVSGETYTLQFSRASALFAQDRGFNPDEIAIKPARVIPDLFFYAMKKNHGNLARNQVDAIREKFFPNGLPMKIVQRLADLYAEACLTQVIDLNEEDDPKNAELEVEM